MINRQRIDRLGFNSDIFDNDRRQVGELISHAINSVDALGCWIYLRVSELTPNTTLVPSIIGIVDETRESYQYVKMPQIISNGLYVILIHPSFGVGRGDLYYTLGLPIPPVWRLKITVATTTTYKVGLDIEFILK